MIQRRYMPVLSTRNPLSQSYLGYIGIKGCTSYGPRGVEIYRDCRDQMQSITFPEKLGEGRTECSHTSTPVCKRTFQNPGESVNLVARYLFNPSLCSNVLN